MTKFMLIHIVEMVGSVNSYKFEIVTTKIQKTK